MTITGVFFYFWPQLSSLVVKVEKLLNQGQIFTINIAFLNRKNLSPLGFPILFVVFGLHLSSSLLYFLTPSLHFFSTLGIVDVTCVSALL